MDLPQLQPLTFGELLDRAFTYYRRHFRLLVGIMAIPEALIIAGSTLLQSFQPRSFEVAKGSSPPNPFAAFHPSTIVAFIVLMAAYFVLYSIAMGATTFAVSEIHLGRVITVRAAYQKLRGRTWRIFALIFALSIRWIVALILCAFGFVLAAGLIGAAAAGLGRLGVVLGILIGILGFISVFILTTWYFLRFGCSIPALLLENLKASQALRHSAALAKGNIFRILAVVLLMSLVRWTVAMTLQGPFIVVAMVIAIKTHAAAPFWLNALSILAAGVGGAATGPLLMLGLVLLYFDIRVRKEGFDLEIMMSALDGQSPELTTEQNYRVPSEAPISPMNIAAALGLTLLTFGLYIPIWFMQKRAGLNQLRSSRKVGLTLPIAALVLSALVTLLNLGVASHIPWIYNLEIRWDTMANAIAAGVIGFLMVIQAFQVRSILEDHSLAFSPGPLAGSIALVQQSSFSVMGTFFFGIFYLQHKINEMVETWPQTQPTLGSDPLPAA